MADRCSSIFTLLGRFTDQGVTTYRALDARGQFFQVHFLDPRRLAEHRELLASLGSVSPAEQEKIIWAAEVSGSAVIVTEPLEGSRTLAEWIEAKSPKVAPEPPKTAPPTDVAVAPSARVVGPGEFTRLFGPPKSSSTDDDVSKEPEPPQATPDTFARLFGSDAEEEDAAAETRKKETADTFDRLFGPGSKPLSDADADEAEETAPPAEPEASEPERDAGGLGTTRELRPEPPEREPGGGQPDSFLRMFGPKKREGETAPSLPDKPSGPTRPGLDSVQQPPDSEEPPGGSGRASGERKERSTAPGEFTRLFGHVDAEPEGPSGGSGQGSARAAVKPQERDTEDIMKALEPKTQGQSASELKDTAARAPAPPPPVQPPSAAPAYSQPASAQSEFDRVVRGRAAPPPSPAAGEGPKAEPQPGRSGAAPAKLGRLAMILGVIVVTAVILVVLFAVI